MNWIESTQGKIIVFLEEEDLGFGVHCWDGK